LFDNRFRVPGTSFHFGYDAILGLVPIVGDSIGSLISLYLVYEAVRLRVGIRPVARMLINVAGDWFVGLIPLADIYLDAAFKANAKNALILATAVREKSVR
tara:strand:+ start:139760 stop:140062 length:303 start_codon:yes stop_codon:yes gene_type:complete